MMKLRLPQRASLFPLSRFRVEGESMCPTLQPGDRLLVNRAAYLLSRPGPGDIVVLRDPEEPERALVKRVASSGLDGGSCFVVGDNPAASRDSRRLGPVPRDLILGRVWFRY
jgi:nickel-type superoxide dismutase maturation protease